jgi:Ca2+-binding EF-hand superfamily protein
MQIKGNAGYNPLLYAQGQKARLSFADAQTAQRQTNEAAESAGPGPAMMASNAPPIVDVNTILENWGSANAIADLNVDGIVDAQDLAMVLSAAQDAPPDGGTGDSPEAAWNSLTGGDLNGDGVVDAVDLAIKLNDAAGESSGGSNDSPEDPWNALTGGDLNGDGVIDAVDLAIKLNDAAGESSGGSNDSPEDPWNALTGGDLNGDGVIDAVDLAIKLNDAAGAGSGGSNDGPGDGPGDEWGALTGGDHNGDGNIDAADLTQSLNAISNAASTEQMIQGLTDLIFQTFDTDGDGVLTESNFPDTTKAFGYFDRDNNGVLERNELLKGLTEEYERAMQNTDAAMPGPFAKRWLETFSGLMPIPAYTSPMRLQDMFGAPKPGNLSPLNASILSAQA